MATSGLTIQSGKTTFASSSDTHTVTISAVDWSKAWIEWSIDNDGLNASQSLYRVRPGTSTQIIFESQNSENAIISWKVIEYASGVAVQHNSSTPNSAGATINYTLSAVDLAKSWNIVSFTSRFSSERSSCRAYFSSTTQASVELVRSRDLTVTTVEHDDASVQEDTVSFPGTNTTQSIAISTVDTTKSILFGGYAAGADSGLEHRPQFRFTTSTNVEVTRATALGTNCNVTAYSIEISTADVQHVRSSQAGTVWNPTFTTPSNTGNAYARLSTNGCDIPEIDENEVRRDTGGWTAQYSPPSTVNLERSSAFGTSQINLDLVELGLSTGGVDTSASLNTESLTLSSYDTTITTTESVVNDLDVDSLLLSIYDTTITTTENVSTNLDTESLTLSSYDVDVINIDNIISVLNTESLNLSSYDTTITTTENASTNLDTESLNLSSYDTTITTTDSVFTNLDTESLNLSSYDVDVLTVEASIVNLDTESLTLSSYDTTITTTESVVNNLDEQNLILDIYSANVDTIGAVTTNLNTESLTLSSYDTTITTTDSVVNDLDVESLNLSSYNVDVVNIENVFTNLNTESLTLSSYDTTITTTDSVSTNLNTESLTLSSYNVDVSLGSSIDVDVNNLILDFHEVSVDIAGAVQVNLNVQNLVLGFYDTTITTTENVSTNLDTESLTLSSYDVDFISSIENDLDFQSLVLDVYSVTIISEGVNVVSLDTESLTLSSYDVDVLAVGSETVNLDTLPLNLSSYSVDAISQSNSFVVLDVESLTLNSYSVDVDFGVFIQPTTISLNINTVPLSLETNNNISQELLSLNINIYDTIVNIIRFDTSATVDVFNLLLNNAGVGISVDKNFPNYNEVSVMPTNWLRKRCGDDYDNERDLHARLQTERNNHHGVCVQYHIITFDTSYNKIWGEDDNRRFVRSFPVMAYYELPKEDEVWSKFGIEGLDQFSMFVTKLHFTEASKFDKDGAYQVSSSYTPKIGDVIKAEYNDVYYEIVDVGEEEDLFLQGKHTYEFKVRTYRNEHADFTSASEISATVSSLEDIFDLQSEVSANMVDIGSIVEDEDIDKTGWW